MNDSERRATDRSVQAETEAETETADRHLDSIPDGAGCTEMWEHLSEQRESREDGDELRTGDTK